MAQFETGDFRGGRIARGDDAQLFGADDLVDIRQQHEIARRRIDKPAQQRVALVILEFPALTRVQWRIVNDDMRDAISEGRKARAVVGEIKRLRRAGISLPGFCDDEAIDDGSELVQPDLKQIELVEKRKNVEDPCHARSLRHHRLRA